ncbi:MAG: BMP family ABC transporter substrate-binding protein [Cellulosilyticum sp.]|nr:BMP family ABC transporter substrate-binding protein [Cellulosilyticum sp.]
MKKALSMLLTASVLGSLSLSMVGCGSSAATPTNDSSVSNEASESSNGATESNDSSETPASDETQSSGYELALVTDIGTIDDKSFNQGAWEGVEKYATENNKTYKYYQPTEKTTAAYVNTISLAIEGGAKVVVCPGYLFEPAVFEVQDTYPDIKFILLDGEPHNEDYSEYRTNDNVCPILYQEDQAGFLAGYAVVKDGYTKLGFMGGMAVPAVMRYGYGFVQGAELAATEMNVTDLEVKYHYTGGFNATPEVQAMAASWYQSGTEVIFGCGGAVGNSVMSAAEAGSGKVIGVDVDQSPESDTVISSAMKQLAISVYDVIGDYYEGNFPGKETLTMDVTTDGVGLPMSTSKFSTFTQADYDAIYAKLVSGEIKTLTDADVASATELPVTNVTVSVIE